MAKKAVVHYYNDTNENYMDEPIMMMNSLIWREMTWMMRLRVTLTLI